MSFWTVKTNLYFKTYIFSSLPHHFESRFSERVGKNVILTNLEFRFPLIQYLQIGFPFPMTIGNILGHVFMDVGAAWDNSREFTNYSLLQAKYEIIYLTTSLLGYAQSVMVLNFQFSFPGGSKRLTIGLSQVCQSLSGTYL